MRRTTKRQLAKEGLFLLSSGLLICLLLLGLTLGWPIYKAIQSRDWPRVDCFVDYYEIPNAALSQSKTGNYVHSRTNVQYSYKYKGKWYISGRPSYNRQASGSANQPSAFSNTIKCYVNPDNPYEVILYSRYNFFIMALSIFPVIIMIVCIFGLFWCLKTLRK